MIVIVLFRLIIFHPTYVAWTLYNLEQVLLSDFYTLYFMLCITLHFMLYTGHFISWYNSYSNTFVLMASCCSVLNSTAMQYIQSESSNNMNEIEHHIRFYICRDLKWFIYFTNFTRLNQIWKNYEQAPGTDINSKSKSVLAKIWRKSKIIWRIWTSAFQMCWVSYLWLNLKEYC